MTHLHDVAFRLIRYSNGTESEVIWNSRDGYVPRFVRSQESGSMMNAVACGDCVPDYEPKVGERIIVDMTDVRARVFAVEMVDERLESDKAGIQAVFSSYSEAVESAYRFIKQENDGRLDVVVVNAGYIEQLKADRDRARIRTATPRGLLSYYDRSHRAISLDEYSELSERRTYKQLARDVVGPFLVITIWTGYDPEETLFPNRRPRIFETMVFENDTTKELRCIRWSSEREAIEGHSKTMVEVVIDHLREKVVTMETENVTDGFKVVVMDSSLNTDASDALTRSELRKLSGTKGEMTMSQTQTTCHVCGDRHDHVSVAGKARPKPMDFSCCFNCGAFARFTDDMRLRPLEPDEEQSVTEKMRAVAKKIQERGRLRQN